MGDRPLVNLPTPKRFLDLDFHPMDIAGLRLTLDAWIRDGHKRQICVIDAHSVILSKKDPMLKQTLRDASLALSDSVPILWLSRLLGKKLPCRITGYDLCECLCELAEAKGYRLFLLGSTEGVLSRMVSRLKERYPRLEIVGSYAPPMVPTFSDEHNSQMVMAVNRCRPDILWVGLPAGKHEKWIHQHLPILDCKIACGVGAAFDFFAGTKKRAPNWMQKSGLEWLFRLSLEPKRLWKRYLIVNTKFLFYSAQEILVSRLHLRS